ncbi:uncharacterized protein LOC108910536 [Anoplophora glabripennis]|uniref:uncharacterized protein LOC108910536 n=1 Tax=Anoplophora glabripennis TaxID=217634 RepID=UPI000873551D|nr:uncharacterized protein LOC108910536 [Anoplophora glabripennis]
MPRKCKIPGCVSGLEKDRKIRNSLNIRQASLFSVPKDNSLRLKWSTILGINLSPTNFICDYHFKEEDIVKEVKHNFPDGTSQIIPRGKWTLLPGALPINSEPRHFETAVKSKHLSNKTTDNPCDILRNSENLSATTKRSVKSLHVDTSEELRIKRKKISKENNIYIHQCQLIQPTASDYSTAKYCTPQTTQENCNGNIVEVIAESDEIPLQILNDKKTQYSFENILSFIKMPPAWLYMLNTKELIFVHVDTLTLTEKLRVFLTAPDMSVSVLFNKRYKYDLKERITCDDDLLNIFEQLKNTPACTGTGLKRMSASVNCCGIILDEEKYQRQQRNPRCKACRVLRHRLQKQIARQHHAVNKTCNPRKELKSFKVNCKRLQKKVIYQNIFQ